MPKETMWPQESKGACDFHENIILWYGPPKIGKTTFASKFPKALILLTEDGAKHLKVHSWQIRTWTEFCGRVAYLRDNIATCPFQYVIIDTVDNLSDLCIDHVCSSMNIPNLSDAGYGKAYQAYEREFKKQVRELSRLGLGVGFISHAEKSAISVKDTVNPYASAIADNEGMVELVIPTIEKRARKCLLKMADMIFYITLDDKKQRVIHTRPSLTFEAGSRVEDRLPATLPLDYEAVVSAYYGGATVGLITSIEAAETYLAQHQIDGFDDQSGKRRDNSRLKTLGTIDLKEASIPKLEELLQKYRMKAKAAKKGEK